MPNKGSGKYGKLRWQNLGSEGCRIYPDTGNKRQDMHAIAIVNGRNAVEDADNAEELVARYNACAGLTDEELKRVRAVNEMYEALLKLSNEASATLGIIEPEMREAAGNTNVNVLRMRIDQGRKALALADGREPERGEP